MEYTGNPKQTKKMGKFVNRKLDVAILLKTKKKGNRRENVKDYAHFFSGVRKNQRARAGILLYHIKS